MAFWSTLTCIFLVSDRLGGQVSEQNDRGTLDRAKKIYVCFRFQAEKKLGMVGRNNILFCQNILFSR